jgi:hypothetical protein
LKISSIKAIPICGWKKLMSEVYKMNEITASLMTTGLFVLILLGSIIVAKIYNWIERKLDERMMRLTL